MKKIFTFIFAIVLSINVMAQCPLNQAVDFTATDIHGTEIHLFDILDGGQSVLIDFFFTTCTPCQAVVPNLVESYYAFGCNQHDIFYMEIAIGDSDAACLNWVSTYGVEYPTISGVGGGTDICNAYGIESYPTVILIKPDHSIVINDLWPMTTAQAIITILEAQGIQQHDCGSGDPQVTIYVDQITETTVTATFTPNESCAAYYYTMATESELQQWMGIAGLELPEYLQTYGFPGDDEIAHTFTDLTPYTDYLICAVPADADGNLYEVIQKTVNTTPGGNDEIIPDFTGTDLKGNEIHLYDILDGGQYALLSFFQTDYQPCQPIAEYLAKTYSMFGCNERDVFYMEISPSDTDIDCSYWIYNNDVKYPTISRDGGGNTIAQSIPVAFYPTVMLVRPDHTIAVKDIYPIQNVQTIIDVLADEGIQQYECEPEVVFSTDVVFVVDGGCLPTPGVFTITNMADEDLLIQEYTCDEFYINCCTEGYYKGDISGMTIAPSESLDVWVYPDYYCRDDIEKGILNLKTTLGEYKLIIIKEIYWGTEEVNANNFVIYPNPANDFVKISGENLGNIGVFNVFGQKIEEFVADDELDIVTSNYENGVYFVKIGEKTQRFVVAH